MERPKVGLAVLVFDGPYVLLGKRKNTLGAGCWGLPGGHLEFGESWADCAQRELGEEAGIVVSETYFYGITNDVFPDNSKHYVTIFMAGNYQGGEVQNREPEKCEEWRWFSIDQLPENLFLPLATLVKQSGIKVPTTDKKINIGVPDVV